MVELRARHQLDSGFVIAAFMGNICQDNSDAIVNAANELLNHGGGVALAISKAAGPSLQRESHAWVQKNGRVTTGKQVAYTGAGNLPCKYVVHVVGPVWRRPLGLYFIMRSFFLLPCHTLILQKMKSRLREI